MNIFRILRIARKDFGELVRSWRILFYLMYLALWVGIVFLIRWSGIFPLVMVVDVPAESVLLPEILGFSRVAPGLLRVVRVEAGQILQAVMQREEADLGVLASLEFDQSLGRGEQAPIEFVLAEGSWSAPILKSLVESAAEGLAEPARPVIQVEESVIEIETHERRRVSVTPVIPLGSASLLGTLMVFLVLIDQGSNALFVVPYQVQREREEKTLEALLITPLTHLELLSGKFIGSWLYGLLTSAFFMLPILLVAPNIAVLISALLISTAVLILFGLFVGVVFTNTQVANSFISIFSIPWMLTIYLGWLEIEGPWFLNLALDSLPTVQMGHALMLALGNRPLAALAPMSILLLQLLVLLGLMVAILKRQENV